MMFRHPLQPRSGRVGFFVGLVMSLLVSSFAEGETNGTTPSSGDDELLPNTAEQRDYLTPIFAEEPTAMTVVFHFIFSYYLYSMVVLWHAHVGYASRKRALRAMTKQFGQVSLRGKMDIPEGGQMKIA
jgi:hypothetical protein